MRKILWNALGILILVGIIGGAVAIGLAALLLLSTIFWSGQPIANWLWMAITF